MNKNLTEVFLIIYFKTREISEDHLRTLVKELVDLDKKIIISTHSLVPDDILKKCDGFVYDKDNHQEDMTHKRWTIYWAITEYFTIYSPFFYYGTLEKSYCYAAAKSLINGINYCKSLGFDIVHVLEYDVILKIDELSDNFKIISEGEFDAVFYKEENTEISGPYACFLLKNLPIKSEISEIRNHYEKYSDRCEVGSYEMISQTLGDGRIKHKTLDLCFGQKITSVNENLNIALYENGEIIEAFIHNFTNTTIKNICMYHSNGRIVIDEIHAGVWICHYVAKKSDYFFFHIYQNDILQKKWDIFSQEEYDRIIGVNGIEYHNK